MGQIRCTQFFTDGKYGWSDTVWSIADTPEAATTLFIKLAVLRYRLLGTGPESPYIRTSDDLILRDADVTLVDFTKPHLGFSKIDPDFTIAPANPKGRALPTPSDVPYSAILIRMQSGTRSHRMTYLRGAPDEVIVDPAGPLRPQAWKTAFDDYVTELTSGRWFYLRVNRDPLAVPFKLVAGMNGAAPDIIFTVPAHGFISGDFVQADKFVGTDMPRGKYTVLKVTDDTLKLKEYFPLSYTYLRGGRFQKNVQSLGVITSVIIRGETHRNTGRPFDSPAGRRKKRSAVPH